MQSRTVYTNHITHRPLTLAGIPARALRAFSLLLLLLFCVSSTHCTAELAAATTTTRTRYAIRGSTGGDLQIRWIFLSCEPLLSRWYPSVISSVMINRPWPAADGSSGIRITPELLPSSEWVPESSGFLGTKGRTFSPFDLNTMTQQRNAPINR